MTDPLGHAGADDDRASIPWYAIRVAPATGYIALRPVPEDEIEELDELPPWYPNMPERPTGPVVGGRAEARALVALAVGRAVRAHRSELGLSQDEYGWRTRRTQPTVSRLERGRLPLTVSDVIRIAVETGRSIRIDVLPDETRGARDERIDQMRLGPAGAVRVAVGSTPRPRSGERGSRPIP